MMNRIFRRRVSRLEQWLAPARKWRIVLRYEGPGSERFPQPTREELEQARHVVTLVFVPAKDGRPATPEEIAEIYPD
jgi:hypothetical protein